MDVLYDPLKGIDITLRPRIWMHITKVDQIFHKHSPQLFEKLKLIKGPYDQNIEADVFRTFPYNKIFAKKGGPG